jgi:PDZ domain-containing secreted protein
MEKTLKINDLLNIVEILGLCKNDKDLKDPSACLGGIRLSRKINSIRKKHFEEQEELFKKFGVEKTEEEGKISFDWRNKTPEEQVKINKAVTALNDTSYTVDGLNFMTEEDFIVYTRELKNNLVVPLYDYLVIEA